MAKKNIKVPYSRSSHLRAITRKLLVIIDTRIELVKSAEVGEIEKIKASNDLLFGNKLSIAGNLVILADLLAKLGDETHEDSGDNTAKNIPNGLTELDIALIKDFLKKQKSDEAKV